MRPRRERTALPVGLLLLALVLGGCSASRRTHGDTPILGEYAAGTLKASLPRQVSVLDAAAALEAGLRADGFTLIEADTTDARSIIRAEGPGSMAHKWVKLRVEDRASGTAVRIKVKPLGHEPTARRILDRAVAQLGL